jgi:hypothetical protein
MPHSLGLHSLGTQWGERLDEIGRLRQRWRDAGYGAEEIARWTDAWAERQGWRADAGFPHDEGRDTRRPRRQDTEL